MERKSKEPDGHGYRIYEICRVFFRNNNSKAIPAITEHQLRHSNRPCSILRPQTPLQFLEEMKRETVILTCEVEVGGVRKDMQRDYESWNWQHERRP